MDSIDITDSIFSLDVPEITNTGDYSMYIYIGAAILIAIVSMFIFKFYQNKNNNVNDISEENICENGGFCTMNQQQAPSL
jgi:hypothetical protein